jgi:selenocysteine lyase/cysteine desulfurase
VERISNGPRRAGERLFMAPAGSVAAVTSLAISISHVQWITGYRYDLRLLADLAHSNGALLIVDAMQSAGVVPLDVCSSEVDVLVTGSYKLLCSYAGIAVCYMRPDLTQRFNPPLIGARSNAPVPTFDDVEGRFLRLPDDSRRLEYASTSHSARVALAAAIDHLLGIDVERIFEHTQRLGSAIRLAAELVAHGVCASPRHGLILFAPHFFNDETDIDRALTILSRVLPRRTTR